MRRLLALLSLFAALAAPAAGETPVDPRSVEILRYDCASALGRREVTLFANGTIRLRDGPLGEEWMGLAELGPDERDGVLHRLADEDLSAAARLPRGVDGDWVERCELRLQLPGRPLQEFRFGRYDTLPLALSRVVRVAREMGEKVLDLKASEHLPEDYEPRRGDVLKRVSGRLFRVFGFTSDDKGVELEGVDDPLTIYVRREELRREFVALVSRAR
jgi:hypothetical protein